MPKENSRKRLRRQRMTIRAFEQFGIERGDTAILAVSDDDIREGEIGYFHLPHSQREYDQFRLVCARDRTCFQGCYTPTSTPFSKTEGLCLRDNPRKCGGQHEGGLIGRVVAVERKGESVETTLPMRPPAEYAAPPPCTTKPKHKPRSFRLPDLHHEIGREIFFQFDATPEEFEKSGLEPFSTYISYRIKERLNALAHRYGLERDGVPKERLYLAACRSRFEETKGITAHTPETDSIINAVLQHRGNTPAKVTANHSATRQRTVVDDEWPEILDEWED